MRRCLPGDLLEAAALLAASNPLDPTGYVTPLLNQADAAHRYAKRFGRAHPTWGNGSLMARAAIEAGPRNHALQSAAFLTSLALVATQLASRKRSHLTK